MFYKNVPTPLRGVSSQQLQASVQDSTRGFTPRLLLVPPSSGGIPKKSPSPLFELLAVAAPRCSSFFAEAAVLVLVLALLDRFMVKGWVELNWIMVAFGVSFVLLAASILTDFSSRRWLNRP